MSYLDDRTERSTVRPPALAKEVVPVPQRVFSTVALVLLISLAGVAAVNAGAAAWGRSLADATPGPTATTAVEGLVVLESPRGVAETLDRIEAMLKENGLTVVARVDHAANAGQAEQELRPTQLLIFGNPKLGTELMRAAQTAGIDLPQKFLAWEDEDGQTYLGYNDPAYLAERHGIAGEDAVLHQVSEALAKLAAGATAP